MNSQHREYYFSSPATTLPVPP
ncbi:unnamed protein product [Oppiella nova]|uniref:Uncharacterized protein n=1 Tax=Oppiella nova TaxID=334625 RepID=A0A7R9MM27_9ACAR|nr:unnamed protein product [Oppiella nova]CAG2179931.1 unnamed protein product [Oppiella nova]